jgi:hypothetical protein
LRCRGESFPALTRKSEDPFRTVRRCRNALVDAVEQMEGAIDPVTPVQPDTAGKPQISRRAIWACKTVAAGSRQTIVQIVAILMRIPGDRSIDGAPLP